MIKLTKKDYVLIARAIKGGTVYHDERYINKVSFVNDLIEQLEKDNPLFNRSKFREACGINPVEGEFLEAV